MKIKQIPLIIVSLCLATHLWFSNSQLLTHTSPEYTTMWGIIALSYSIIGAWSVLSTKELKPIIAFAFMDGTAVFLKINPPEHYNLVIGLFYAVYTAYIILITWKMSQDNKSEKPQEEQKAITEEVKAIESKEETPQLTQTACMNKVKGMLKGGPTPEKRENAVQLCMMLSIAEQPKMMEYINEKFPKNDNTEK